jgi:hypothetical protein
MTLWWIGNAVLIAVVIPVVVLILRSVVMPAASIKRRADGLVALGRSIMVNADGVHGLLETQRLVGMTGAGIGRYGAALDEILEPQGGRTWNPQR